MNVFPLQEGPSRTGRTRMLVSLFAAACAIALWAGAPNRAAALEAPHAEHSRPPGVAWFAGSVPDAFALAASNNKPVFLYWGAVWCPPCQELKATVFKRQDFLDRLNLFVPVYLDGDDAGAQAWGEKFQIAGYPTVLVLRGDQTELERVSGGMDLSRYAEVLDLALGQVRPAHEVLAALDQDGATQLSLEDCRRLAFNGWQLEDDWLYRPETLAPQAHALERAAKRCPAKAQTERARLEVLAALAGLHVEAKELDAGKPLSASLRAQVSRVLAILGDGKLSLSVGDTLDEMPPQFFKAMVEIEPGQRDTLRKRWFAMNDALSTDKRFSASDQIDALGSKLIAAKALDPAGKIPKTIADAVTHRIDDELAREHEPYARASLVNSALNALDTLDDDDRAYAILSGEVKTSAHPYYYMADLADLEEKRGHKDVAIKLLAQSFQTAEGPATRFQWGVGYVRGLVRMKPQDDAAIRDAALSVLAELEAAGDLHGRTKRSLGRLEKSLGEWNKDKTHAGAIASVHERMEVICGKIPAGDPAHASCDEFLAKV